MLLIEELKDQEDDTVVMEGGPCGPYGVHIILG